MQAAFAARFRERPRDEWFADLGHLDACLTPVLDLDEMLDDPHMRERGMAIEVEDEGVGTVRHVGVAPKLLGTPGEVRSAPAPFGRDTDEVLAELGESPESIAALKARGVVA